MASVAKSSHSSAVMTPHLYRIVSRKQELADVVSIELEGANPAMDSIGTIQPGQFNMVYAFGQGEIPISVSQLPREGKPLVHTIRAVGAVSAALCAQPLGSMIGLRGPFGRPWPLESVKGKDIVIMTGGIGLAPLRPLIEYLHDLTVSRRDQVGTVSVLCGARSPELMLFPADIRKWSGKKSPLYVDLTVDHVSARPWNHHVGVVTTLLSRARFRPEQTVAFLCGPEVMMRFGVAELLHKGVPPGGIYVSMERNMKCAVGHCGHCQLGPHFICKDGPVFSLPQVDWLWRVPQL